MKLTDMKCDPSDYDSDGPMTSAPSAGPRYPYGLRIYLDDSSLDKLGLEKLPELNSEFEITARVKVVNRNESSDPNDPDGDNDRQTMELQITALGLAIAESDAKKADKLYSKA